MTPESATDFFGTGFMSVISISLIVGRCALGLSGRIRAPVENAVCGLLAEQLWIDGEGEVCQFTRFQRAQLFDRPDETVLFVLCDHIRRQRPEFPDVILPIEGAVAVRMGVSDRDLIADDRAALERDD